MAEDSANLVHRAAAKVAARAGRSSAFALQCHNDIPPGRGLGSSAAAVVGGAVAANEALGRPLSQEDLLDLTWRMEGHADNAAPALLGGVVLADVSDGVVRWRRIMQPWDVVLVVPVPEFALATARPRAPLPDRGPLADA